MCVVNTLIYWPQVSRVKESRYRLGMGGIDDAYRILHVFSRTRSASSTSEGWLGGYDFLRNEQGLRFVC